MLRLLSLTLCLLVVQECCGNQATRYVGVGYNLLSGNPDGENVQTGGADPGILATRHILAITPGNNPPEVIYEERSTCTSVTKNNTFFSTKTYQDKLYQSVTATASYLLYSFSTSHQYTSINDGVTKNHEVYFDSEETCNLGRARYEEELAYARRFTVSEEFAVAVCKLPVSYNTNTYNHFLDTWGTHVIKEVELGTKRINRYSSSLKAFFQHAQSQSKTDVTFGGAFMGFETSMAINFEKFKDSSEYHEQFGSHLYTLSAGSKSLPEPIALTMDPISSVLDAKYWQTFATIKQKHLCGASVSIHSLQEIQKNLLLAVKHYPAYRHGTSANPKPLKIPIAWPIGTYGFPKTSAGCPGNGMSWREGWMNYLIRHSDALRERATEHKAQYCMKGDTRNLHGDFDSPWPKGDYCIFKYGPCPAGFQEGVIAVTEHGGHGGERPDGGNNQGYCCRNDGLPTHKILLPNGKPFSLIKYTRGCQQVIGMSYSEHTEPLYTKPHSSGAHPAIKEFLRYMRVTWCNYRPSSHTGTIIG